MKTIRWAPPHPKIILFGCGPGIKGSGFADACLGFASGLAIVNGVVMRFANIANARK